MASVTLPSIIFNVTDFDPDHPEDDQKFNQQLEHFVSDRRTQC